MKSGPSILQGQREVRVLISIFTLLSNCALMVKNELPFYFCMTDAKSACRTMITKQHNFSGCRKFSALVRMEP
jgi:hypothetical protein